MVDHAGYSGDRVTSFPSGTRGLNPPGNSSLMNPVEIFPDRQRGCCIIVARNGTLCWIPSI